MKVTPSCQGFWMKRTEEPDSARVYIRKVGKGFRRPVEALALNGNAVMFYVDETDAGWEKCAPNGI